MTSARAQVRKLGWLSNRSFINFLQKQISTTSSVKLLPSSIAPLYKLNCSVTMDYNIHKNWLIQFKFFEKNENKKN
jgi:hypothetical protein